MSGDYRDFLPRALARDWMGMRAADSDREATADRLRRAHEEGRIDTAELEERLERCYSARTYGDLDAIVGDLPRTPDRQRRRSHSSPLRLAAVVLLLIALMAASHGWLLVPLLFFVFMRFGPGRRRRYYHWYDRRVV